MPEWHELPLRESDPDIASLIAKEKHRQMFGLEMIPSENLVSLAVLEAMGSVLTNKYSEGYPGKRYYGGNVFIDEVESIARERAKKLFRVSHANVQPYSGSPANQAACFALLDPGEKLTGMSISHGGHLTHGVAVNFSGKYYSSAPYVTSQDGWLDYDLIEEHAKKEQPKLIFCGATAYSRVIDFKRLGEIAQAADAFLVADVAHIAGLIAGGAHPSPVGHADVVTTTTHKTLRGPRGAMILCNGNPSDPLKAAERSKENLPTLIDRAVFPGLQGGPHNHTTAGIAVALKEAATPEFADYAKQIVRNSKALAEGLLENGFELVTGGTDNHLMVVDLRSKNVAGKEAELLLDEVGITVNKNMIPFDPRKPYDPSGIRLGTPLLTTRGMKEGEMTAIAGFIAKTIEKRNDTAAKERVASDIKELCSQFIFYA
ncbi:MAG: serine hydroxymethyltransferase [Candidatus Aenigmarchaeota archaeon]|nr:serine hydroxymethyltransferase [Candidatus Aenigmarchaeota archaeon]